MVRIWILNPGWTQAEPPSGVCTATTCLISYLFLCLSLSFCSLILILFFFFCFSLVNVVVFVDAAICKWFISFLYLFSYFVADYYFPSVVCLLSDCVLSSHSSYLSVVYLRFQLGLSFSLASSTSLRGGVCRLVGQWTHAAVFKDLGLAFLSRWVAR